MSIDSIDTINEQIAELERERERVLRDAEGDDFETVTREPDVDASGSVGQSAVPDRRSRSVLRALGRIVPRRRSRRVGLLLVCLLIASGTAVGVVELMKRDGLPPGVAFHVDGQDITQAQLATEIQTLHALYGIQAPTSGAALDTFQRDVAKAYAVSLVLDQAASARHIVIADKQAQDVLTRYMQQQFGNSSDAVTQFDTALGQVGTSESDVLTEIKRQLAVTELFGQVTAGITVSDAQVAAEFTQTKASLATPEQRDIHNIVVQASSTGQWLMKQLAAGASFDRLASQFSLDAATNKVGGDLGSVSASQLDSGYAKVAFAAPLNKPFGPIQTRYGWNVGEVVKIVPAAPANYAQVKGSLHDQMLLAAQLTVWRAWLGSEIRNAHVEYARAYLPADPNSAPTGAPGSPEVPGAASSAAGTGR
jgi:peptidyl-prolyl cis-trans isomerase C